MENTRLIVGLRRNRQRTQWPAYKLALCEAAAVPGSEVILIEAEDSVRFEKDLFRRIEAGIQQGFLIRSGELTREEAQRKITEALGRIESNVLNVWLCHGADFAFKLNRTSLARCAFQLLEFDSDTVYAATEQVECGIGIDVYESELSRETRYTVDVWMTS
jgi:hypothetical protein